MLAAKSTPGTIEARASSRDTRRPIARPTSQSATTPTQSRQAANVTPPTSALLTITVDAAHKKTPNDTAATPPTCKRVAGSLRPVSIAGTLPSTGTGGPPRAAGNIVWGQAV